MITQEEVKERFEYRDGSLYYKYDVNSRARKGMRAGWKNDQGRRLINIDYVTYREHRIIWLLHHGYFPKNQIDHIDRDFTNNRIENLRDATESQNKMNKSKGKSNFSSVFKGVCEKTDHFRTKPWHAMIQKNKKHYSLGYFSTEIEAALAYNEAAIKLFREFAVLNEIEK